MSVKLGSNIQSLMAQRKLADGTTQLASSFERLSSGLRINRASDDAAGLAISSSLKADTRVYTQAIRNVNDGLSALSIAEGALDQLVSISIRQRELATQASNGSYSTQQRRSLHQEANALVDEFNRIVESVEFNGRKILNTSVNSANGGLRIQAGYGLDASLAMGLADNLARNVGNGTFQPVVSYFSDGSPWGVSSGDLNNDGYLDIVTSGSSVRVLMGNGDGSFRASTSYPPNGGFFSTESTLVDMNNDGKLDAVFASSTGNLVHVFIGNGDGSFRASVSSALAALGAGDLSYGDFNGDGRMDITVADSSGVNVFLGNGDGSFQARVTYAGVSAGGITAGDFNGDGLVDIIQSGTTTVLLLGNSNGTFRAAITVSPSGIGATGLGQLIQGDYNNDGHLDLSFVSNGGSAGILMGNGDGSFKAAQFFSSGGSNTRFMTSGDMNGDGFTDIVTSSQTGITGVIVSNGDGTFKAAVTTSTGGTSFFGVTTGDFNGDGAIDLVGAHYNTEHIRVLLANPVAKAEVAYLNLNTRAAALGAMTTIDQTLKRIASERSMIGSLQSRMSVALNNLRASTENFDAAASRITDADIAQESANLVRTQILQQAAASVLAQANQQPALALNLLR